LKAGFAVIGCGCNISRGAFTRSARGRFSTISTRSSAVIRCARTSKHARLDPDVVAALWGSHFGAPVFVIEGGRGP
jgi:hypothetical protein